MARFNEPAARSEDLKNRSLAAALCRTGSIWNAEGAMADKESNVPAKSSSGAPSLYSDFFDWHPLGALRRQMNNLFNESGLMKRGELEPFERFFLGGAASPAVDVVEKENEFAITAELPGLDEKNVEVKLSNGSLIISGEKKDEKEEKDKDYYFSERRYGSFRRAFRIPDGVDADKIEAAFDKGVLTVRLPKTEEAQKSEKKIDIKAK
jgi:HSP20 family protein